MTTGHFLSGKRIIVAGGGIAGLTFVATLNQLWDPSLPRPNITIIERESREASIKQDPYVLSINGGSKDDGLVALQQLGLLDDIRAHSTLNSGIIRVWGDNWKQLATIDPKPYGNLPAATMRITREELKRILTGKAEAAHNASWRWACACTEAERLSNGQIRVSISDSETGTTSTQGCDLLIVADGASSNIRASLRPDDMQLRYAGATQIGGISHFPEGLPHPIHEDYGLQMSSGEGVCCIYTPFDKKTVGWALSREGPERKAKSGSFTADEVAALKTEALQTASMFDEPFQRVIEATDPASVFIRSAKEKPPFKHSQPQGVVFIGDANHILNCYMLVGADLALKDGWDLAEQICRNSVSLETAVAAYDKLSIARTEHPFSFSHERIRFGHSTGLLWKAYKYGMAAQRAMAKKK
jgi:2-polyprenyl-6-methoxyphenol hydroxylase-like FAD-dependent oxidoreductase